jgi:AcrR family transcriptional regulator
MGAPSEGLRERKKRAARETIAATARRLFAERGFDAVTVAQIAAAADVSEKTVFNHFATKEDLAFAGREQGIGQFVAGVRERPPDQSVLDAFRSLTHGVLDDVVAAGHEDLVTVARIIGGSRALQERLTVGWESGAAAITAAVAETTGAAGDDLVPAIVARTLWFTHRSVFLGALNGLLAGEDREQLAARLRVAADRAYDQLAGGLGEYGRLSGGPPAGTGSATAAS